MSNYHQTDIKRARFRVDSTIHDDKLASCLKLNCHGIHDQLPHRDSHASPSCNVGTSSKRKSNPSPARSQVSVLMPHSTRKRPRKSLKEASGSENEADAESSVGRVAKPKDNEKASRGAGEGDEDTSMAVDEPNPPLKSKAKAKSRPISRARPPPGTSMTASFPTSGSNNSPVVSTRARPKLTSRTSFSQSHSRLASDSEASTRSRPRTRSHVREESRVRDASRSRTISKLTKADISGRARRARKATPQSPTSEAEVETEIDEYPESDQERRGRDRKKRRVGQN